MPGYNDSKVYWYNMMLQEIILALYMDYQRTWHFGSLKQSSMLGILIIRKHSIQMFKMEAQKVSDVSMVSELVSGKPWMWTWANDRSHLLI